MCLAGGVLAQSSWEGSHAFRRVQPQGIANQFGLAASHRFGHLAKGEQGIGFEVDGLLNEHKSRPLTNLS